MDFTKRFFIFLAGVVCFGIFVAVSAELLRDKTDYEALYVELQRELTPQERYERYLWKYIQDKYNACTVKIDGFNLIADHVFTIITKEQYDAKAWKYKKKGLTPKDVGCRYVILGSDRFKRIATRMTGLPYEAILKDWEKDGAEYCKKQRKQEFKAAIDRSYRGNFKLAKIHEERERMKKYYGSN